MPASRRTRTALLLSGLAAVTVLAGCGQRPAANAAAEPASVQTQPAAETPAPPIAPVVTGDASGGLFDVRPLAQQAEAGVQALIGEPTECGDSGTTRHCRYARAATQIDYIDGMAQHIVIGDLGGAAFEPATLAKVGLGDAAPTSTTADAIRWEGVGGLRAITLERGADGRAGRLVIDASLH